MRRFSSRGVVALEEEEVVVAPVEDAVAPASVEAGEAEAEVVDSAAEGSELEAVTDEGEAVADTLEVAAESLRIAAANGGIDKYSAAAIGALTQHLYDRVGYKAKAMPAMESFGGASTRIGATQLAMEGIKEGIKEIWRSIVAALKKMVAWVTGHWNKVFGAAESMVKRAKAVALAADGIGSKKKKNPTFENSSLVKALYTGSDIVDVAAGLDKVTAIAKDILVTKAEARVASGKEITEAIGDVSKKDGVKLSGLAVAGTKPAEAGVAKSLGLAGEGLSWSVSEELLGGTIWAERGPTSTLTGPAALKAFGSLKAAFVAKPETKVPTKETVKTLDATAIDAIAKKVEALGDILVSFRSTEAKLKTLLDDATKAADRASKEADTEVAEGDKEGAAKKDYGKEVRSAASNLPKYIIGSFSSATTYPLKAGQAALTYCEQSIKQYE